jgi:hypothetical protein
MEMGLFSRTTAPVNVPSAQPGSMTDRLAAGSNAALDKAAQIYNKNPKLIGGLAAVAGAILLNRMKRGRG